MIGSVAPGVVCETIVDEGMLEPSVGCMRSTTIFFGKRVISLPRWFFSLWSNDVEIFIEEDLCVYKITETTQSSTGPEIGLRAGKPLYCLRITYISVCLEKEADQATEKVLAAGLQDNKPTRESLKLLVEKMLKPSIIFYIV